MTCLTLSISLREIAELRASDLTSSGKIFGRRIAASLLPAGDLENTRHARGGGMKLELHSSSFAGAGSVVRE
jgi:hypothetical protein